MGEADLGIIRALARVTGASLCFVTPVFGGDAAGSAPGDEVFKTALVVWHMDGLKDLAGRNELRVVGAVSLGVRLQGEELRESLESGNDGLVARLEGGYLDAGQGTGGMLNLTGSALTVSVRLRSPLGAWGKPLFSKHGGHDRLVYNLFSFNSAIGFELGTRDTPGMTQVMSPLDGEYHLFAQRWNKCWIHAVSTNLVHWTELRPALWEDYRFGGGVQSGGSVLDRQNSSGLSPDPNTPPLVAFWSGSDNRSTCISYSLDKGRTWTKYAKNPVLVHPERDPKVFWHEPPRRWVMLLYGNSSYFLFTSTNLLQWTEQKESIPDCFECPDMFQLPVNGEPHRLKWVLVRGNGKYSVGDFDGSRFMPETDQLPCDSGPNFHATQSRGDIAGQQGRRIQIAWMRDGKYPDMPFNQQMTFPCDLTLRMLSGSLRLFRKPAPEIELLHRRRHTWKDLSLAAGETRPLEVAGGLFHILADVEVPRGTTLNFRIRGATVTVTDQSVACSSKPAPVASGLRTVEILVDRTSIEVFANDGETSLSACCLPTDDRLAVVCSQGSATMRTLRVFELESTHPDI